MPQSAKDVTIDTEYTKCLVIGAPGTGKSIFASTFPTPGYVFDFSNGIQSYRGMEWDYEQFPLNPSGWTKLEKELVYVRKAVNSTEHKYSTIVVDDATAMERLTMEQALLLDPKRSASQGPIWNVHYALVRNLMEGKLRQILDLPCNIVLIAHLNVIQDKESGSVIKTEPMLPGQLPTIINGYFDEVYYSSVRQGSNGPNWVMQTIPLGHNTARSRWSGRERLLPDFIPNDYNILITKMREAQNKKKGEKHG
jgi:hypothetical protein